MKAPFNRRAFLRGAFGTVVGLPMLEYMLNTNGTAYADGTPLPLRYFVQHTPAALVVSGSNEEGMTPKQNGANYVVTPVLKPLQDRGVLGDVSVVSGLFCAPIDAPGAYNSDYHGLAVYAVMSGMRAGFSGADGPHGPSAEQVVAAAIGGTTKLKSQYYQIDGEDGAVGIGISYEQTSAGAIRELTPQVSPALAYKALFTGFVPPNVSAPDPKVELDRRLRLSSLSFAKDQIAGLQRRLSANDKLILDEHLTRVREIERRLTATGGNPVGLACHDPMLPAIDPPELSPGLPDQVKRAALFVDLIEVAFACDLTRVIALAGSGQFTSSAMLHEQWNSIGGLHREVQHGENVDQYTQPALDAANGWFVDIYAQVLQRLKAIPEGTGTILDNTAATYFMEGGKGIDLSGNRAGDGGGDENHAVDNAVALIGGHAGGLKGGLHVNLLGQDLHPAVVMNTAMKAVGVTTTLGEISGLVSDVL